MDPKFKTSFIPKTSLATDTIKRKVKRSGVLGIFTLITLILFLSVITISVGVFLFEQFLNQSIKSKNESLERARAAFEPALIQRLSRLDTRINVARNLLDGHLAPSVFFEALGAGTLESVRFKDFNYSVIEDGRISVSMSGEARSFAAVALQSDIFGRGRFLREPIFSDLNLDQKGNVVFKFSALVDPLPLSYKRTISTRVQPAEQPGSASNELSTTTQQTN